MPETKSNETPRGRKHPKPVVDALREGGHDVLWARTDCTAWADTHLLDRAETEARLILTLDKDFWQIAAQRRPALEKSGVVLFRTHPATPDRLQPLVRMFVAAGKPWAGHVSVVSADGIQMLSVRRS